MTSNWYTDFLQRLREFRTNCVDALRDADLPTQKLNLLPVSRAIDALERHWKKQFPQHALPHRQEIDRHLRFALPIDVLDLMTKDIHDAEVKALGVIADFEPKNALPFVSSERLSELQSVAPNASYDLCRLLRLCEELNVVSLGGCHMATAVLVRALIDHVPPVFGSRTFSEVANNYRGTKSFKDMAKHLDESSRKIADGLLHSQLRRTEILPSAVQVDFRQSLDVILSEVVRILRGTEGNRHVRIAQPEARPYGSPVAGSESGEA